MKSANTRRDNKESQLLDDESGERDSNDSLFLACKSSAKDLKNRRGNPRSFTRFDLNYISTFRRKRTLRAEARSFHSFSILDCSGHGWWGRGEGGGEARILEIDRNTTDYSLQAPLNKAVYTKCGTANCY